MTAGNPHGRHARPVGHGPHWWTDWRCLTVVALIYTPFAAGAAVSAASGGWPL